MQAQHSPPANHTTSQRNPAVLTPTARVPLECTPSVHQLSANLDRGSPKKGAAPVTGALMEARGPGTQESRTHLEGSKR
ncbi:hypothetical protein O181_118251 [Austropuccinia psidii MF-1]|uniref:Uncharacterized protein n=1 Tax=Austropuccinia psidii MF-1 TaxID=1389203 RepID=A0A9Q3KDI7_9BASI|nr:hypothetical protein [Austropuccinia psidii MF-1]